VIKSRKQEINNLFEIDGETLVEILDIFLPYTVTFGRIYEKYSDFINALSSNRICFLPDTNILLRAKDMASTNAVSRNEKESKNYKIIAAMAILSKKYLTGNIFMPALLEFTDYEALKGENPKDILELTYKKFFDARVIIECMDFYSLIDYITGKRNNLSLDPLITSNEEITERLRNECYQFSFDSFLSAHNILGDYIFHHDIAYCYLCKAWLINHDSKKTKEDKYEDFIDWIVSGFLLDPILFTFVVKYFANLINFPPKKGRDILMRIENQVKDILFIRNFYMSSVEHKNKDVIFVTLDKKLFKLACWCSGIYDEEKQKIKLNLADNIFDDCHLSNKFIDKIYNKLSAKYKRTSPDNFRLEVVKKLVELQKEIEKH